jgi:hypothetical protein
LRTLIGIVAAAALTFGAPVVALADAGNPNYRSTVNAVTPSAPGLKLSVLNFDDRLLLQNNTHKQVLVYDYESKPYIRADADGTIAVNTNSQAYYLNDTRTGTGVSVPKGLGTQPAWKVVSRDGRYDWHDHRIHWMAAANPPNVKDKSKKTKIDDWTVPIAVNGSKGDIAGTLTWVGKSSAPLPVGAIVVFAGLLIVLSLAVVLIRRRRGGGTADATGGGGGASEKAAAEAW